MSNEELEEINEDSNEEIENKYNPKQTLSVGKLLILNLKDTINKVKITIDPIKDLWENKKKHLDHFNNEKSLTLKAFKNLFNEYMNNNEVKTDNKDLKFYIEDLFESNEEIIQLKEKIRRNTTDSLSHFTNGLISAELTRRDPTVYPNFKAIRDSLEEGSISDSGLLTVEEWYNKILKE